MSALTVGDLWWIGVAAFVAGLAGALALAVRAGFRRAAVGARTGFLGWFKDAVDEHVEPKFKQLRDEQAEIASVLENRRFVTAEDVRREAERTADAVRADLLEHAQNEEGLIRDTVAEVLSPLAAKVEGHIVADAEAFQRNDTANEETAVRQVEILRRLASSEQQRADIAETHASMDTLAELVAKLTRYTDDLAKKAPDESE